MENYNHFTSADRVNLFEKDFFVFNQISKKEREHSLKKNFVLSILLGILLTSSLSAYSQLGQYVFTGLGSCPNQNPNIAIPSTNASLSAFANTNAICVATDNVFDCNAWNTTNAIDFTQYNSFTVTSNAGYNLNLNSFSLTQFTNEDAVGGSIWFLRSSIDNFTTDIATGTANTISQSTTVVLPAGNFSNLISVTFRLYLINANSSNTIWTNDDITVDGIVIAIPPADPGNPTSNSPQCASSGVTLSSSGTPPLGETWYWQTISTGTNIANSGSTFLVNSSGTYYLRAQDNTTLEWSSGAGSISVVTLSDVSIPIFSLGAISNRCQGVGTETYSATASDNTGLTYNLDAASLAGGNTINASTGEVTYSAGWSGTSTITATATGCNGTTAATHTVTITSSVGTPVFAMGSTSVRCEGVGTETYSATSSNNTGLTYNLDAASLAGGNTINASTGEVTYSAGWSGTSTITASANGCNGPKTTNHTVTITPTVGTPVFTSGSISTRCQGAGVVTYKANATNNTGIIYSLDGASLAGGNTVDGSTGIVSYEAAWSGTSIITASVTGCNGSKSSTHTVTVNATVGSPVFTLGSTSTKCQGGGSVLYAASALGATLISFNLDAASVAGGNLINSANGSVTYNSSWTGTTVITATASGCNGPKTATHSVTITATVGTPVFIFGSTSVRCQGSEVVNYGSSATTTTGITYSLNAASITGGNTINSTNGDVTYAFGWSGTSTIITASAAGCSGPKTATHTVTITPTVGTPLFALGTSSTRCQGAGAVTYTSTSTNNTGITYDLDGSSLAGGNTIDNATGAVTYDATWTGISTISATATGCNGPKTAIHTVTITATVGMPVFTLGGTSVRCQGAGTVTYSASATTTTGITYTLNGASIAGGNSIVASTGAVTYASGWSGTSTITATASGCNGPTTATHTVTITPTVGTPVYVLGATSTRCQGAGIVIYTATSTTNTGLTYSLDASSITGGNTIDVNTGDVTFTAGWSGTSIITATATGCNGPKSSTHTVTITATVGTPIFAMGATSIRCQGTGIVTYSATATSTTGITYTLDATSITGGNSINAATGAVTYASGWSGASTITATAAGCNGPTIAMHTVTITPTVGTPVFTLGSTSTRCQGAATVNYSATASSSTGITYSLDASSITGGNTVNSSTGAVTYSAGWSGSTIITASAAGCNGAKTATHTVTITPTVGKPIFSLGATSSRCRAGTTVTYTASATNNTSISYSLDAASITAGNTINSSTSTVIYTAAWFGTSVITATATGCNGPSSSTHTATTNDFVTTPIFSMGGTSTRCQGSGVVSYGTSANNTTGITYSLDGTSITGGNTINFSTGALTYAAGWSGTTTITASAAGCSGPLTANHIVTITPTVGIPVFALGATSSRCQAAGTISYTASSTNSTGITYSMDAASTSGGNTINAATGDVTFVASWVGTSTITASATGCNGPITSTHSVTVNAPVTTPVFSLGASSSRCQASANVFYSASASNTTGITYIIDAASIAAGLTINVSNGKINYLGTYNGSVIITASAAGCYGPQISSHTAETSGPVTTPVFSLGATSTRCQGGGVVNYAASATFATSITYSLNAAATTAGNTINSSTSDVTYTAGWTGSTIITASAAGCNGPTTATHTVTITPSVGTPVFTLGSTSTRCQGAGTVTYSATSTNNTGITYDLDAASLAGGNTINNTTGGVTYNSSWSGSTVVTATASGCNGPKTSMHTVTITPTVGTPTFILGNNSTRCQGAQTIIYTATATNTTGITYTMDAINLLAGNSIVGTTGSVTYIIGWSGTTVITAKANGCNGPVTSSHTVTTAPTVGTPVFTSGASSTRCQGAGTINYTANSTNSTGMSYSLDATSLAGGNSINGLSGDVTYVAGWSGTSVITASGAGCNGPRTSNHTVTTTPTVGTPVFATGTTSTRCQGAGITTYNATATTSTGMSYSLDVASLAGGNSIILSTGAVTYVAGWSGTTIITASAAGCNGPITSNHTVTITPYVGTPVFTLGSSSTRCQSAGTVTYIATASNSTGISYSLDITSQLAGNAINASTGVVTYTLGWSGTSTITASAAGCSGPKTATHTVTITPTVGTPVFTLGATSTRCQGAVTVTYTSTSTNNTGITYDLDAASLAGSNTINNATGAVTYDAAWTGTSVITATATGCNGPKTSTHTITSNITVATPVFSLGGTSIRCQGAGSVTYTATASNTTGITYTLNAASIIGGNTIISTTGAVTYASGWSGTTTITATAAGCNGPATATHTVTITPTVGTPVFALGATSTHCQGATTINYTTTATTNTGLTYRLDASSITGGNTIDVNSGDVTYVADWSGTSIITATATGCNGPKSTTHTVTITATVGTPVFTLGATSTRCQGAGSVTYASTASSNTGIVYTLDAASLAGSNSINSSTGAVTYTAGWTGSTIITATASGCNGPSVSSHSVTITPTVGTPVFAGGTTSTRCQGAGVVNYGATATTTTGITYSLNAASITGGNSINSSTGDVTYAAGWSGTSTITASAAGCSGPKTATHTVTITPTVGTPVFSLGATSTRCQGSGTVTYTSTSTNNTGITYDLDAASLAGSNTINNTTGAVTYDAAWTGTSVITATATGCNGPKTATHTITSNITVATPIFSLGATSTRCQGSGSITYTATAANSTTIIYTLDASSITGSNTINSTTGAVTYAAGWSGTSTITATASGCNGPTVSIHTVTITPTVGTPIFLGGATSTRCQGAGAVTYTANSTNSTGVSYSLDAASTTGGNTINSSTGEVTYVAGWSGTSIITATATGCSGPKTATHTVTITATVGAPVFTLGANSTRCQGAGSVTYTATASSNTGIVYTLDAASLAGSNTINSSTGAVTYMAGWTGSTIITATASGCNGPSVSTHTVTITPTVGTPVFSGGATSTRCQGAGVVNYGASATTTTGLTYSLNAASITGGNSINSTTGDVTYAAGWSGTSTITASAAGCSGPKTATHTVTITPTVGTPVFSSGATSTRCQGSGTVTYTSTSTNNTGITYDLDPTSLAGSNTINNTTGAVNYDAAWTGTSVITASAAGCNGPKTATHTVTITPTVGTPVFALGATTTRCQGSGVVTYSATATTTTGLTYTLDATSTSAGNTIVSTTGGVNYVSSWSGTSIITANAAGCGGPITAIHTVTVTASVGSPVFALGTSSSRCQNAEVVSYAASSTNSTSLTYSLDATSTTAGNSINTSTGNVTYLANWLGTSTITATATGCSGPVSSTHTVTNNPSVTTPIFAKGASSTICQGSGNVSFIASATNASGLLYTLDNASATAGNFIRTSGLATFVNTWNGTTIVTATASGCNGPKIANHIVTITPFVGTPVFALGTTSTRCQGAGIVAYTATASDASNMAYALDNVSTTAGNTINTTTGAVTYTSTWTGSSTITITATGCNGITTSQHIATTTPTVGTPVFTLGASSTRCQGANTVTYTATSTNNTGITYSLDATSMASGNTINSSTGAVTYAANWTGSSTVTASATGCNGPKTASHSINITPSVSTPVFSLGATSSRCQNAGTVLYTASAFYTTGLTYSLDAISNAAGNSIAPSTGAVTYTAGWIGTSTVTVSATGCNGPVTSTHVITINTNGTPYFSLGATSTRCQGATTVTYTASSVGNAGVTYSLDGTSSNAGNIINASTGAVTYVANWTGTTVITSTATGCAGVKTATHTVTITPNGYPTFTLGSVSARAQAAGSVTYSATSNNGGTISYSLDATSLAGGNTINTTTGTVSYSVSWSNTTYITASVNGCNGATTSVHTVSINSAVVTTSIYLSDPAQALDRIDPVSTNDLTTATTSSIGLGGGTGAITIDNSKSGSVSTGTSLSIASFVTAAGSNRYMLVTVALSSSVTSIAYGVQSLTKIGNVGSGKPTVELWQLINPTVGTANVVITTAVTGTIKAGVMTFTGVDPNAPYRTPITTGTGVAATVPNLNVTSAVGDLVVDVVAIDVNGTLTQNASQTQQWMIKGANGDMSGGASTKSGAASVNMAWTYSGSITKWVGAAISLSPSPAMVASTTFTQGTAMCSGLNIKGNKTITVTNYVSVTSGTMPANPSITATLQYGGINIITLSNPVYNSVAGTLTWTGTRASDISVPAGAAISLAIAAGQSAYSFAISYDSKAQPSKIDMPVSTYINIDSLNVFTAPYPGGRDVISAIAGSNNYIRIKVSDPFGASDITGVDLTISPTGTTVAAALVASSGCTSTYEYVWNTVGATGNYNIQARAKEGYENMVSALQNISFNFCTVCPPIAVTDVASGKGGSPLSLDVMVNDYDPNNNINTGSLTIVTQPRNGSAILASNKIVYLPNGNFTGKDTITYQIMDLTVPTPLSGVGQIFVSIDPTIIDPCSDAGKSQVYFIPYPEKDARTALLASQNTGLAADTLRTIISLKMPYPKMTIVWDQWEDGYESNILSPQQSTSQVWGDGNPYNGIAPGYSNDIIPSGGSIVLDNTMPCNPRVQTNFFYDGRDKVYSSGLITMTQVTGEPKRIGLQCMKTNISATSDFGQSFTISAGENYNSQDFKYTALFIRASSNNTQVSIDKDNNNIFDTTLTLNEGESYIANGGVLSGASISSTKPIGVDVHYGGVDGYSSREVPIFPATWYSNVYFTPVPTTHSPDTAAVMLCNSLSRPLTINWSSGIPSSGTVVIPAEGVVRFPLAVSATAAFKFENLGGEAFTAIEIADSYTPGGGGNVGSTFDWAFNLVAEQRLTPYATVAWAPGSTDGTKNDNPIWVTPTANTTIYVKYDGNVLSGGSAAPNGMRYDVLYALNALNHKRILNPSAKNDQSGIAIYTSDGTKLAAVYGEDASTASPANPSWDVGSTIQPFCATKIILANDDQAYTMTGKPVTITVLKNDSAFLCTLNPSSVVTAGFLQPKNGTVSANADGSLLYKPNPGYIGNDTLEYNVCSAPAPISVVCDVAKVIIYIDACPTPNNRNIISGQVFLDKSKDGINNDGGAGFPAAKVYLYMDGNCNTVPVANELKDSVITDASGSYQFLVYPEQMVEDDFDGVGGASSCTNGSDGTVSWATNWTDAGDASSIGFCVSPAQPYNNTNAEMVKDGKTGNFALRLKNPNVSATRSVNLAGVSAAYLTFQYRRGAPINVGRDLFVQASSGGAYTTIFTIAGDATADAAYNTVYYQNLLPYASATTSIRFLTSASYGNTDTIYIDNIAITYLKYPLCYITQVAASSIPANYSFSTASQNALTLVSGGTCASSFDYGLKKTNVTVSGTLFNDANGLTDGLVNGTAFGNPSSSTIYAYLVDSTGLISYKATVNSTNGTYSFSQADVLTTYSVVLSTADSALYTKAPLAALLPAGWVSVGDCYGTNNTSATGNETGTPNCAIVVKTGMLAVSGVNFGIEQLPIAGNGANSALNPGGTTNVTFPASTFTNSLVGSDVSPGTITSLRIISYPANTTTLTINGTIYTTSNFPLGGVTIPATSNGQPSQTILIDPFDNFVRVPIIYYTIDNAGKESLLTGTAILQLLTDNDRDGIADGNDIDDDNDGITDFIEVCGSGATTFGCLTGGSDPSADNDNDGIINYKDSDFGTLNAKGCVAILDTDGDGVPNYLDLDSDNDGIPDVVEAFGVDVNGDGIIDNYTDTDGDGLSQNVDANNTGAAGSGFGLGFKDLDGDGIPNSVDLDSDNDGIPDIIETNGVDADNNGLLDVFVDANSNGLNDNNELSGSLMKTGADTNNDGRADSFPFNNADRTGFSNPYDIDSDGDGIVDAIEAGFPSYVNIINGKVIGPALNGWATAILSLEFLNLSNTDNRGPMNYLDIDADDDGITDNVEGQPTFSYVVPSDTDTDGDGLVDAYDVNVNTFGGTGITPYDHDFDGIPDYKDLDTDNDGAYDINEGSKIFSLNFANLITTDADGDGLVDQFDMMALSTIATGSIYKNVANSQMGPSGSWNGPLPSGSNVKLVRSFASGDRDWRSSQLLPIHIISFSGKLKDSIAELVWKVENEIDVDFYIVERSLDGVSFEPVGKVLSLNAGSTDYFYNDDLKNVYSAKYYYRIMQVDMNGGKFYTNVITFNREMRPLVTFKAYPNPMQDHLTLSIFSMIKQPANVILMNTEGKIIKENLIQLEKGRNIGEMNSLGNLLKGLYLVKIITVDNIYVEKVMKE